MPVSNSVNYVFAVMRHCFRMNLITVIVTAVKPALTVDYIVDAARLTATH